MSDPEAAIRERAYLIWERESRPHGRDKEHWEMAARELAAEMAGLAPVAAPKRKTAAAATVAVKKARAK